MSTKEVYAVEFTDSIYESAFAVVSLHTTKRGALKAMLAGKWQEAVEFRERELRVGRYYALDTIPKWQVWRVVPLDLVDDTPRPPPWDFVVRPEDFRIDTYSPQGQSGWFAHHCNGVKVTHLPTGLCSECHTERSQHANKAKAWDDVLAKLPKFN